MRHARGRDVGALIGDDGQCLFRVWAPDQPTMSVHLLGDDARYIALERTDDGYHAATVAHVSPGTRYRWRFADGHERPDPASRSQPDGVHGPSAVVAPYLRWTDEHWGGIALQDYIIYEIHVGTFTHDGTFDAMIPHLDDLVELGITAIQVMPIAQFPGERNWGYDGVSPYAVQNSYGGPDGFARLVDACHARNLAVVLDVVYNHFGPEGSYLREFGPYFTDKYKTPWGEAVNFDDANSDEVRGFFIRNALYWVDRFHVDALRLDAVHAIADFSAIPFLAELSEAVHEYATRVNRHIYVIGESDLNDVRVIEPRERNGIGLDAQWSDDFHHALHTLLTDEHDGYYSDYGTIDHFVRSLRDGYAYTGDYSPLRRRSHGNPSHHVPGERFVHCTQNHDQIGNRLLGERLSQIVEPAALRLAAGALLLAPYIPLLFMGEDYGETHPFLYFIDHGDPDLVRAVQAGRIAEFASFVTQGTPPDPAAATTFITTKLDRAQAAVGWHAGLRALYRELLRLRRTNPALARLDKNTQEVMGFPGYAIVMQRRWYLDEEVIVLYHFGQEPVDAVIPIPVGTWQMLIDSTDVCWGAEPTTPPVASSLVITGAATLSFAPHSFRCLRHVSDAPDALERNN